MQNLKTNINFINGDKNLNIFEKLLYTILVSKEFFFEKKTKNSLYNIDKYINEFLDFIECKSIKELFYSRSPSRIACDFNTFVFLKKNFHKNLYITILDVGCGDGTYYKFFSKFFEKFNYIGIDIKIPSDIKKDKYKSFFKIDLGETSSQLVFEEIKKKYNNIDLIFSQSVLEHVKNDMKSLLDLQFFFPQAKNLHYVPAVFSFFNYLAHGYRRYNFIDIKKIQKHLGVSINQDIVGGSFCLRYYFNYCINSLQKKNKFFNFLKLKEESLTYDVNFFSKMFLIKNNEYPVFYKFSY
jgi:SAM-dependent methyltransferase